MWIRTVAIRTTHNVARIRSRERAIAGSDEFMLAPGPAVKSIGLHEARRLLLPLAREIHHALTRRQRTAYRLVLRGHSCRQIARLCEVYPVDVRRELSCVCTKISQILGRNSPPAPPLTK